ncbi:MAG: hypothetical protein EKK64_06740 [Neisseriaceae bacterium]|nr:MAG: hypothetical protein EKK64_06740 [Neisseriaceae bacterium]
MYCLIKKTHFDLSFSHSLKSEMWKKGKILHRKNGPAVFHSDGEKQWCYNGQWHRDNDLPAVSLPNGDVYFYRNGFRYNFVEQENGTKEYYNSKNSLHKENGPAVIYSNGDEEWWFLGRKHRIDGPAVIYGNKQYWFHRGEFIKCIQCIEHGDLTVG